MSPAVLDEAIFTREQVIASAHLSRFQKVLLLSDGSVTELLCIYTGADIRTEKIDQSIRSGDAPAAIDVPAHARLLHRRIMLTDRDTPQVYAESVFVHDRLSPSTSRLLHESDTPIGKLWKQERTQMYRDIVDIRVERQAFVAGRFGLPADALMLSRTYLLWQDGSPMGSITEKFPVTSFTS